MDKVLTFGEVMICLVPEQTGPLRHAATFVRRLAGAEGNTAIGLAKLGIPVRWVGRVGDDEFDRYIECVMRGEGVETKAVRDGRGSPTAVFFKEFRGWGETSVHYYRRCSAGSVLAPEDLEEADWQGVCWLHLTRITPMLSCACASGVAAALEKAGQFGVRVSVDPNVRRLLGGDDELRARILPLVVAADALLWNEEECRFLFDEEPRVVSRRLAQAKAGRLVVLKEGAQGVECWQAERHWSAPGLPVRQGRDPVGAGDGFNAGFLAGLIRGTGIEQALRLGCLAGGLAARWTGIMKAIPCGRKRKGSWPGRGSYSGDRRIRGGPACHGKARETRLSQRAYAPRPLTPIEPAGKLPSLTLSFNCAISLM